MTAKKVAKSWEKGAEDAFDTASKLMESGKYHHALFFCHLAIEKQLKAIYVEKTGEPPVPTHALLRLAELSGLAFTDDIREQLREINTFNVEARYDDYKFRFYKKATKEYASLWFSSTRKLLLWLKKQ